MAHPPPCTSFLCDVVGLLITALQLGQFIPQHYEMAVDRSVIGVSPWLLFFSSLYTFLAALDTIILGAGRTFTCAGGAYRCFIEGQPLLQMCGSAVLSIGMWYWYLKYSREPHDVAEADENKLLASFFYGPDAARTYFDAFLGCAASFTFVAAVLRVWGGRDSGLLVSFAHSCGLLAAILNAFMWIPQIIVTYTFGHKGALSLGWVFASVVMDIAYSIYLAFMGMHWTVWVNNVPDGLQTGILLIMLLRFEYRDRRRGVNDYGQIIISSDGEDDNQYAPPRKGAPQSYLAESDVVPV